MKTARSLPVRLDLGSYRRCMTTTNHITNQFSDVFGDGRGRLASEPDRYGANHLDIQRLLSHISAASCKELRRMTRPALPLLGRFALVLGFAAGSTRERCAAARDAVITDLHEHLKARPDHADLYRETERVLQDVALCMLIKQDLGDGAVSLIRELFALADPKVDEALGQTPLSEW